MASKDVPKSVRIRTGEGNEYRFDAIEQAAEFYDCNRSDAVAYACDDVPALVDAAREVLERDDLTTEQKRGIAKTMSNRGVEFEIETKVEINQE